MQELSFTELWRVKNTVSFLLVRSGLTEIEHVATSMFYTSQPKGFELESHGVLIRYFG